MTAVPPARMANVEGACWRTAFRAGRPPGLCGAAAGGRGAGGGGMKALCSGDELNRPGPSRGDGCHVRGGVKQVGEIGAVKLAQRLLPRGAEADARRPPGARPTHGLHCFRWAMCGWTPQRAAVVGERAQRMHDGLLGARVESDVGSSRTARRCGQQFERRWLRFRWTTPTGVDALVGPAWTDRFGEHPSMSACGSPPESPVGKPEAGALIQRPGARFSGVAGVRLGHDENPNPVQELA